MKSVVSQKWINCHHWTLNNKQKVVERRNSLQTHIKQLLKSKTIHSKHCELWPTIKDFTESSSAALALSSFMKKYFDKSIITDQNVFCYVVGDGVNPQTAFYLSEFYSWKMWSIDPSLKTQHYAIANRITICNSRSQDFDLPKSTPKLSILVAVHSHADLYEIWNRTPDPKIAVTIPCCKSQIIPDIKPFEVFFDLGIHSQKSYENAKRLVIVYASGRIFDDLSKTIYQMIQDLFK